MRKYKCDSHHLAYLYMSICHICQIIIPPHNRYDISKPAHSTVYTIKLAKICKSANYFFSELTP